MGGHFFSEGKISSYHRWLKLSESHRAVRKKVGEGGEGGRRSLGKIISSYLPDLLQLAEIHIAFLGVGKPIAL